MHAQQGFSQDPDADEQDIYTFKREGKVWSICLGSLVERDRPDIPMVTGAHKFLNVLSSGAQRLRLRMSLQPQEGAGRLDVVEHCGVPKGGAIYRFTPPAGQANGGLFWICDLALLVFGDLPDRIYVQRLSPKDRSVFHHAKKTGQNGNQR